MRTPDPRLVVTDALARLTEAFTARDVEAAVACFADDGAVYGDELAEHAHGHEELRLFLAETFEEPFRTGWEPREVWARSRGDVVWFVCSAEAVLTYDEGLTERVPFQLSGTLTRDRRRGWRFELFNGCQPVGAVRELLAG